ncbi:flagellar basal body P-ring formation chaperone FlgA [Primorskyibacter sp. S87]|uniref:flagellar basal body P-ring formation chaperone FlgA n=1 Tax=Primorskyibacter sp. S87 TaxID=3415126 RepID=UPI003C7BB1B8
MRWIFKCSCLLFATTAMADIVVPTRTIRAKEVIGAGDVTTKDEKVPGAISDLDTVIGQEARASLYPGRPIRRGDFGAPAVVDRNDIVPLIFLNSGLRIVTEGRALGRGAEGETVRVMNLSSRTTVVGRIRLDGSVEVE